ncbi:hypothetical protein Leryth_006675, partial [Lithospermum erythrorhizon]
AVDPSIGDPQQPTSCCTPVQNKRASNSLNSCHDTSPSADTKSISQLNVSSGESLISPPVLKQIKNKVASQKSKQRIQDGQADTLNAARMMLSISFNSHK